MKPNMLVMVVCAVLTVVSQRARADTNLVVNGGFETGNFTGWNLSGNSGYISITNASHSGNYAASFGAIGSDTYLTQSQNLATIAGENYNIDFWLQNDGGPDNDFAAMFDGVTLVSLVNVSSFSYTEYHFTATATTVSTPLEFQFEQNPSYWQLDDVSVTDAGTSSAAVPLPTTATTALSLLFSTAILGGLGILRRGRGRLI